MIKPKVTQINRPIRISYQRKPKIVAPVIDKRNLKVKTPYRGILIQQDPIKRNKNSIKPRHVVNKKSANSLRKTRLIKRQHNPRLGFDEYINKIKTLKNIGKGRILVLVAPGPTILEMDLTKLVSTPNIDIASINKPDPRIWPTKFWIFCDQTQYNRNRGLWDSYKGIIINSGAVRERKNNQIIFRSRPGKGFSRDLSLGVYIGRTTTFAALQIALYMNYDKIYVCGCDMSRVTIEKNGKKMSPLHSYGVNPDVSENKREQRFQNEAKSFDYGADKLSSIDRSRIIFCSSVNPYSFIRKFGHIPHENAIDNIIEDARTKL